MKSTIEVSPDGETSSTITVPRLWSEALFVFLKEHHLGTSKPDTGSGDETIHVASTPAELHPLIRYFLKRSQIQATELQEAPNAEAASRIWRLDE